MPQKTVTFKTIADQAGVSKMTVSLALRNHPRISEKTRTRVQEIAKALNYRPNPLVNVYMAQMHHDRAEPIQANIAYLIAGATPPQNWDNNNVSRDFFRGALNRAEELGYQLERMWLTDPSISSKRWKKILNSRKIQGAIIQPLNSSQSSFDLLSYLALVSIGISFQDSEFSFAMNDQFSTALQAHQKLIKLGYQKIGLVISKSMERTLGFRFTEGFNAAYRFHASRQKVPILFAELDEKKKFKDWVRSHTPDVVLTHRHNILNWLRSARYRVPDEIGFASLNVDPLDKDKAISGICQRSDAVGAAAVDLVVGQFNRNERGPLENPKGVVLKGNWIKGNTVRALA